MALSRLSNVDLPLITYSRGELMKEIKFATYSFCYMCKDKFDCTGETKEKNHCMNYKKAKEIQSAIRFTFDSIREQKK